MELAELHRTIHGRTAEREVASGEMYRKTKKHGSDAMSGPLSRSPCAILVAQAWY